MTRFIQKPKILVLFLSLLNCYFLQAQENFRLADLHELLARYKPETAEELMKLLPQELRSNSLLSYESRSTQGASELKPRVILHNKNADFVITFSGGSTSNSNAIELYQFDEKDKVFDFRRLDLGKAAGQQISESNPKLCQSCHFKSTSHANSEQIRRGIRPNWDPYFFWEGFYGSQDDGSLVRKEFHEIYDFRDLNDEKRAFKKFLSKSSSTGIYQYLPGLRERFYAPRGAPFAEDQIRPLLEFTKQTFDLNFQRVVAHFQNNPEWNTEAGELVRELLNYHDGSWNHKKDPFKASIFLDAALGDIPLYKAAKESATKDLLQSRLVKDAKTLQEDALGSFWLDLDILDRIFGTHFGYGTDSIPVFSTIIDPSKAISARPFNQATKAVDFKMFDKIKGNEVVNTSRVVINDAFWEAEARKFGRKARLYLEYKSTNSNRPCGKTLGMLGKLRRLIGKSK